MMYKTFPAFAFSVQTVDGLRVRPSLSSILERNDALCQNKEDVTDWQNNPMRESADAAISTLERGFPQEEISDTTPSTGKRGMLKKVLIGAACAGAVTLGVAAQQGSFTNKNDVEAPTPPTPRFDPPTMEPTVVPTVEPTVEPTYEHSVDPPSTPAPTTYPTYCDTYGCDGSYGGSYAGSHYDWTEDPTDAPTVDPSVAPTDVPTVNPTPTPPTVVPTVNPTPTPPTVVPSVNPTPTPPTVVPTVTPTVDPTVVPTIEPTPLPTESPTTAPTSSPTAAPTITVCGGDYRITRQDQIAHCGRITGDLRIERQYYLDSAFASDNLQYVDGALFIYDDLLHRLDLPNLHAVGDSLTITHTRYIHSVELPSLETVGDYVLITSNLALETIDLASLIDVNDSVTIGHNNVLQDVVLPSLNAIGGQLYISYNDYLQSVEISDLHTIGDSFLLRNNGDTPTCAISTCFGENEICSCNSCLRDLLADDTCEITAPTAVPTVNPTTTAPTTVPTVNPTPTPPTTDPTVNPTPTPPTTGPTVNPTAAFALVDLATVSSPYGGSTVGNGDFVTTSCGGGDSAPDQGFSYLLQPGQTITIGQTYNNYDSRHELRYGGEYPGDNVVACVDDPDYTEMTYTNSGVAEVPVYFIIDAYTTSSGDYTLAWTIDTLSPTPSPTASPTAPPTFAPVLDLATLSSPYSGSTVGNGDFVTTSCGSISHSAPDQGFSYLLQPGQTIIIGQTFNNYDSRHELRYGGEYPGDNVVACLDDPDYTEMTYTNSAAAAVPVYFIIDAWRTGSGDFTLAWTIETTAAPTVNPTPRPPASELRPFTATMSSQYRDWTPASNCVDGVTVFDENVRWRGCDWHWECGLCHSDIFQGANPWLMLHSPTPVDLTSVQIFNRQTGHEDRTFPFHLYTSTSSTGENDWSLCPNTPGGGWNHNELFEIGNAFTYPYFGVPCDADNVRRIKFVQLNEEPINLMEVKAYGWPAA